MRAQQIGNVGAERPGADDQGLLRSAGPRCAVRRAAYRAVRPTNMNWPSTPPARPGRPCHHPSRRPAAPSWRSGSRSAWSPASQDRYATGTGGSPRVWRARPARSRRRPARPRPGLPSRSRSPRPPARRHPRPGAPAAVPSPPPAWPGGGRRPARFSGGLPGWYPLRAGALRGGPPRQRRFPAGPVVVSRHYRPAATVRRDRGPRPRPAARHRRRGVRGAEDESHHRPDGGRDRRPDEVEAGHGDWYPAHRGAAGDGPHLRRISSPRNAILATSVR